MARQTVAVIDYGMGNLRSVLKALEHVADTQARILLTADPKQIANADRIVFPGQGAARDCMRALRSTQIDAVVRDTLQSKPFLGVCMGLQVLMSFSEENEGTELLGILPGNVQRFPERFHEQRLKVPHMGWNNVYQVRPHPLFKDIHDGSYFYFVHSYYVVPEDPTLTVGVTEYGVRFTSAIARDNLFAIQCHPEKSSHAGLQLLKNFINWDGQS